jgi:hypothetical protein
VNLIARSGDQAPGVQNGVHFSGTPWGNDLSSVKLNDHDHVAFIGFLNGDDVVQGNWAGVWSNRSGNLELLLREGSRAPGFAEDVLVDSIHDVALDNRDRVAIMAGLVGPGLDYTNSVAVWREDDAGLALVGQLGSGPLDLPGATHGGSLNNLVVNDVGQVAFGATWVDTTHPLNTDEIVQYVSSGIWVTDIDGQLHTIARTGDTFEVTPGDVRRINAVSPLTSNSFNARGQLIFRASFMDGSDGVFVFNGVIIPEPSSPVLLVLGLLTISALHWRSA